MIASRVSIVLPTFNGATYLRESLDSCLSQTYVDIELIVVDGGSTDGTLGILRTYADPRLKCVHQPANSGRLPGALNLGFAHTSGDYLTWMQDDDLYEPHAIATMVHYLDTHPEADFVYADMAWMDGEGNSVAMPHPSPRIEELRDRNCIGHCFLYRRGVHTSVGEYSTDYLMAEDFEYWVRISLKHRMQFLPEVLYWRRWHPRSLSCRDYGSFESLRVVARAQKRWLGLGWLHYNERVAAANVGEAFAAHSKGDLPHVRRLLPRGLARNPLWLANRGVLSLLAQCLLGARSYQRLRRALEAMGPVE